MERREFFQAVVNAAGLRKGTKVDGGYLECGLTADKDGRFQLIERDGGFELGLAFDDADPAVNQRVAKDFQTRFAREIEAKTVQVRTGKNVCLTEQLKFEPQQSIAQRAAQVAARLKVWKERCETTEPDADLD